MLKKTIIIVCLSALLGCTGLQNIQAQQKTNITIYQSDFAVMHQMHKLEMNRGVNELFFGNIPVSIHPNSVFVDYDEPVLNTIIQGMEGTDAMYARMIGENIILVSESGQRIAGVLRQYRNGQLGLKTVHGETVIISNADRYRLIVEEDFEIHGNGISVSVQANHDKTADLGLLFSFSGISWQADYAAVLSEDETAMQLETRAVITNRSGMDVRDASVRLLAGEVRRQQGGDMVMAEGVVRTMQLPPPPDDPEQAGIFEYQRFDLSDGVNIPHSRVYTTPLISKRQVKTDKQFFYRAGWMGTRRANNTVDIRFLIENKEESGLGRPLPSGQFRVFTRDNERIEFLGGQRVDKTTKGQNLRVTVGKAFDLHVDDVQVSEGQQRRSAGQSISEQRKITIHSSRDEESKVLVQIPLRNHEELEGEGIFDRNHVWITVPANGKSDFLFTITRTQS